MQNGYSTSDTEDDVEMTDGEPLGEQQDSDAEDIRNREAQTESAPAIAAADVPMEESERSELVVRQQCPVSGDAIVFHLAANSRLRPSLQLMPSLRVQFPATTQQQRSLMIRDQPPSTTSDAVVLYEYPDGVKELAEAEYRDRQSARESTMATSSALR